MTELSIIIPTRNCRANIDSLCLGMQCQVEPDFKIIFVDNASTDGTFELLHKYAVFDRRIEVLSVAEPCSPIKCCQAALQNIKTPYTILLNGNKKSYLSQYYTTRMLDSIRKSKSDFVYVYDVKLLGENMQILGLNQPSAADFLKQHNSLTFSAENILPEILFSFDLEPWFKLYDTHFLKNVPFQDYAEPFFWECVLSARNIFYMGAELCYRNIMPHELYNPDVCEISDIEKGLLQKYNKFEKFKNIFIQYKMHNLLQAFKNAPIADKPQIFDKIKHCVLNEDFSRYNAHILAQSEAYPILQRLSVSNYAQFATTLTEG